MDVLLPVIIVGIIGLIAGVGLSLASKFMSVPTDERIEKITEALPGANCGSCGYSGCAGYAAAVASGDAAPDRCAPGGTAATAAISEILGVKIKAEPKAAFIACGGNSEAAAEKYEYANGMRSCKAAAMLHSGPLECAYGCIGFGDCANACPFGAISLKDGKPYVCREKCVGCGICTEICPKGLISLLPISAEVFVSCSNKARGAAVAKACSVSCVACRMCERVCEAGAITVTDNLATVDYTKCTSCGKCKEVCKRGVLP